MVRTVLIALAVIVAVFVLAGAEAIRNAGKPMPGPTLKRRHKDK